MKKLFFLLIGLSFANSAFCFYNFNWGGMNKDTVVLWPGESASGTITMWFYDTSPHDSIHTEQWKSSIFYIDVYPITDTINLHVRTTNNSATRGYPSYCSATYELWLDANYNGVDRIVALAFSMYNGTSSYNLVRKFKIKGIKKPTICNLAGNPISAYNGNKIINETDIDCGGIVLNRKYTQGTKSISDNGKYWRNPYSFADWTNNWNIYLGNYKRFGPKSVRCLIKSGNKSWFFL